MSKGVIDLMIQVKTFVAVCRVLNVLNEEFRCEYKPLWYLVYCSRTSYPASGYLAELPCLRGPAPRSDPGVPQPKCILQNSAGASETPAYGLDPPHQQSPEIQLVEDGIFRNKKRTRNKKN